MINIANPIVSTVMLESYNNKIKKVLKYGNKTAIRWYVLNPNAGQTDVVLELPGGISKTVSIERFDISTVLPADDSGYVVADKTLVTNNPDIEDIQNQIITASNISRSDFKMIYSPEFAMCVLIWVTKGVFIPPQDIILINEEAPVTPKKGDITLNNAVYTKVIMKTDSLAYVGSITVETTSAGGVLPPLVTKTYDLSTITNCGIPGTWKVSYDLSASYTEQDTVDGLVHNVLTDIGTIEKFEPEYRSTDNAKDYTFSEEGKVKYDITSIFDAAEYTLVGKLSLIITNIAAPAERLRILADYPLPNSYRLVAGRREIVVNSALSDQDILDNIKTGLTSEIFNDIRYPDAYQYVNKPLRSMYELVDITHEGDIVTIKPKAEFEYNTVYGLMIVEIKRVDDPIELYTVDNIFDNDSTNITYEISPGLTVEEAASNVILDILTPVIFMGNRYITENHLNVVTTEDTITITPTVAAASYIDCNVVVTLDRLVPRIPILKLSTLPAVSIPEPDKSAPGYSLRAVLDEVLLNAAIAAGSEEIIDLDTMDYVVEERWNFCRINIPFPKINTQLIGALRINYTEIRPGVLHTDLDTVSNIDRPGMMMLPKALQPNTYPRQKNIDDAMAAATVGMYDVGKMQVTATYENNMLTIAEAYDIQPNTTIGTLKVIYVNYDTLGNWVPKLNLTELTNNDTPGTWAVDVPTAVTEDNYSLVVKHVIDKLQKQYSVSTAGIISTFVDGVITVKPDPTALIDAAGEMVITANVVDLGLPPASAFKLTHTSDDNDNEAGSITLVLTNMSGEWKVWVDDVVVVSSNGLLYNEHVTGAYDSKGAALTFSSLLFISKSTTIAVDATSIDSIKFKTPYSNAPQVRTTVVDSFSTVAKRQAVQLASLTTVPTVLPPCITSIEEMFHNAKVFDQDISMWDIVNVVNAAGAFNGAEVFNQDISTWNTSNIKNMDLMFTGAYLFNQDISGWDVGNVIGMNYMFRYASEFNQDLSGWNVSKISIVPTSFDDGAVAWVLPKPTWSGIVSSGSEL